MKEIYGREQTRLSRLSSPQITLTNSVTRDSSRKRMDDLTCPKMLPMTCSTTSADDPLFVMQPIGIEESCLAGLDRIAGIRNDLVQERALPLPNEPLCQVNKRRKWTLRT